MADPFTFERSAREPRALALIAIACLVLLALIVVVDAALWIVAILALLTLPAVIDAVRDTRARLVLDDSALDWRSGRREQSLPLARIEEVRLATRLDFSQRATVHLVTGEKLRIPPECLPPGRTLDGALAARGVPHHRSLFSF
jgi:hypothetical protein